MNYIVLDMEWNQAMSREQIRTNSDGLRLEGEIMQVGAVKLNDRFEIVDTFETAVQLRFYKKLHYRVAKMTHIQYRDLRNSPDFPAMIAQLREWCGPEFAFFTWGPDDYRILDENLIFHRMRRDWLPREYNLQLIFNDQKCDDYVAMALEKAVAHVGLEFELQQHNALNDAYYTARLCSVLDMPKGLADYDEIVAEIERRKTKKAYFTGYRSAKAAMADPEVQTIVCPWCRRKLACDPWKRAKRERYVAMPACPEHGPYYVRVDLREVAPREVSAARAYSRADAQRVEQFRNLKEFREKPKPEA